MKKFLSILIVYIMLLTLLPVNFLASSVKAAEISGQTNLYQVGNYNLLYEYPRSTAMYGNYGLILTDNKLYMVKEDYVKVAYQNNYYVEGFSGVKGDNAYLYSSSKNGKNVTIVNLKDFSNKTVNISPDEHYSWVNSSVIDKNGGLWFMSTKYNKGGKSEYSVLRFDPNTLQTKKLAIDGSIMSNFTRLSADSNGSVWYLSRCNSDNTTKMIKLDCTDNITKTEYNVKSDISKRDFLMFGSSFTVDNSGIAWFKSRSGSNYSFLELASDNNGFDTVSSVPTSISSVILKDGSGSLWTNDYVVNKDGSDRIETLSKFENGEFIPKYMASFGSTSHVAIEDDSHIVIANNKYGYRSYDTAYAIVNDATKPLLPTFSKNDADKNIKGMQDKINEQTKNLNDTVTGKNVTDIQNAQKELNSTINALIQQLQLYNQIFGQ